jgi:uncharacterized protein (DUF433 family)
VLNGLRVSEATGANIEALGTERGHRTLVITRKGGKVVTVPLAPRTARAIDLAVRERCEGPVFVAADGWRLGRHGAARIVQRVARRAGITKAVGPHTLRHAFITAALDAGVPLRDVQEAASHADPRTTMRYDRGGPRWTGTLLTSSLPLSPVPPGSAPRWPPPGETIPTGRRRAGDRWLGRRTRNGIVAFCLWAGQTKTVTSEQLEMISTDPAVMHGQAVITGTRVPVSVILDCLDAGITTEQITVEYPTVTEAGVRAAAAYGAALAREELVPLPQQQ